MPRTPLVAAVGLLLLGLVGCAEPPSPVDASTAPGAPAFPRISGTVVSATRSPAGDWHVHVRVADGRTAYARARSLLTGHGYQLTYDEPDPHGGAGQACTTALCVTFTATPGPGADATVEYELFHSTGVSG